MGDEEELILPPPIDDLSLSGEELEAASDVQQAEAQEEDGVKRWERPWKLEELRDASKEWSLAADAGVCVHVCVRMCVMHVCVPILVCVHSWHFIMDICRIYPSSCFFSAVSVIPKGIFQTFGGSLSGDRWTVWGTQSGN